MINSQSTEATASGPTAAGRNFTVVALYFFLAYAFSTLLWLPALLLKTGHRNPFWFAAGMFGPTVSAFVTQRVVIGNWRAVQLWTTFTRFLFGLACGGSAVLLAAFTAAFLMTKSGFSRWHWSALLEIFTLFGPNLLGGPLGEEAGWRGFALARIQRRLNPALASLIVGFLWANWHLPLIFAHVYNVTWWQFVLVTCAGSVFLTFGFNCSGGSTICAIFVHGLYNVGTGIILNDLIGRAELRTNEAQHNIFWIAYGGAATLLCLVTKGALGYVAPHPNDY